MPNKPLIASFVTGLILLKRRFLLSSCRGSPSSGEGNDFRSMVRQTTLLKGMPIYYKP